MDGVRRDGKGRSGSVVGDDALADLMRSERRHAAVMFLSAGIAIGIAFSLLLDFVTTAAATP